MMYKNVINYALSRNFLLNSSVKVDKFLTDEEIDNIQEMVKGETLEQGQIVDEFISKNPELVKNVRSSKVHFIDYSAKNRWLFDKINFAIDKVNEEYFNYDLNGYDYLQYSEYSSEESGHYDVHMDLVMDTIPKNPYDFLTRKLSFSIMLNDDYEEGDFYTKTGVDKLQIKMNKGDMLVFPSFILHGVNRVKSGVRKSLVGWVTGPKFK